MKAKRHQPMRDLFILTAIAFTSLFAIFLYANQIYPLGDRAITTIDFSQQYLDFLLGYKHTLLTSPGQILYSFSKGLGGEMMGHWAYYLMSPFNLLLLLVPDNLFIQAMTGLTYIKGLAMSLSMAYYLFKRYGHQPGLVILLSLSYAWSSYVVLYQLNIMWLDSLILLPLLVHALEKNLMQQNKSLAYLLLLTCTITLSYYLAFMIAIFLSLYACYFLALHSRSVRQAIKGYLDFVLQSLLAVGLSSFVLFPVVHSLLLNKSQSASSDWTFKTNFPYWQVLSRLFNGAFTFDAIKTGPAPLYAGSLIFIGLLLFYLQGQIRIKEKVMVSLILAFYWLSMWLSPLSLLMHGGINPVWYPYRYSFVLIFFVILLAAKGLSLALTNKLYLWQTLSLILIVSANTGLVAYYREAAIYLQPINLLVTLAFFAIIIMIFEIPWSHHRLQVLALAMVVLVDLASNSLFLSREFSYPNLQQIQSYHESQLSLLSQVPTQDYGQRLVKTFDRTPNESYSQAYMGMSSFDSTLDAKSNQLFGYLGLVDPQANIGYYGGIPMIDDFFSVSQIIRATDQTQDTIYYQNMSHSPGDVWQAKSMGMFDLYQKNPAFSLGTLVKGDLMQTGDLLQAHQPTLNQDAILKLINPQVALSDFYQEVNLDQVATKNLDLIREEPGQYRTYKSQVLDPFAQEKGWIDYSFEIDGMNPYFLTIPSQLGGNRVDIYLDGQVLNFPQSFKSRQVLYLGLVGQSGTSHQLRLRFHHLQLSFNPIRVYRFDQAAYLDFIQATKHQSLEITEMGASTIKGIVQEAESGDSMLFTLPYDSQWQAKINNQPVQTFPALNDTLLAIPLVPGPNEIELSYFPKALIYGTIVSLLTCISVFCLNRYWNGLHRPNEGAIHDQHI
ncbi:TPA: YfhO family protein [Streptococcus suis]